MNLREHAGVPSDAHEIVVDGVRLAVARTGSGQAVVCLHAIGHGGRDFEGFADAVNDRFEVIRIDWPGQGRSGSDHQPASAARYAELLAGVLDRLNIVQPIIIGNSIGGAAALLYSRRHNVKALALCDPGGLVAVNAFVRGFCSVFAWFFSKGTAGARWFMSAFRFYYRYMVLPSAAAQAQRERIIRSAYEIAPILQQAWRSFGRPEADLRSVAQSLDIPVWFAWAKQDRVIPLSLCMPFIRKMKNARVTLFKGGHAAFLEQPREFIDAFLSFTSALPDAGHVKLE
jgi:4,5:9,10-diseco-3-hydroxy-5,9,17-trioxoandrosta-1(10),2-diene-4-oate hydrolase